MEARNRAVEGDQSKTHTPHLYQSFFQWWGLFMEYSWTCPTCPILAVFADKLKSACRGVPGLDTARNIRKDDPTVFIRDVEAVMKNNLMVRLIYATPLYMYTAHIMYFPEQTGLTLHMHFADRQFLRVPALGMNTIMPYRHRSLSWNHGHIGRKTPDWHLLHARGHRDRYYNLPRSRSQTRDRGARVRYRCG